MKTLTLLLLLLSFNSKAQIEFIGERKDDYWSNSEMERTIIEKGYMEDISEILPFLPKDHPDLLTINDIVLW